ncbi:MAG: heparinase II/III-family protein [Lachnospiraceae bacterium]|nr:heparinase II/III-family protein [Lachnospiraceae bacterium]
MNRKDITKNAFLGEDQPKGLAYPEGGSGFWKGIPEEAREELIKEGEKALGEPIPALYLTDYMEFKRTGNREHFETKYFGRRRRLSDLVLAECAENKGRFLDGILDTLFAILEESSWCLPAHLTFVRDAPVLSVPDEGFPVIDLFAAETAALAGIAEQLLRTRFAELSPAISHSVDRCIRERILEPYVSCHFWWMGDGEQPLLNWTPWITQNVLLALFTRGEDFWAKDRRREVVRQAAASLDYFLDGYGEDGCCNEGAQYYGHAGLCLQSCYSLLSGITGRQAPWSHSLICAMADYIVKMSVGNGYYINYADCSPLPGNRTARDYAFAKATGNRAYQALSAWDFRRSSIPDRLLCGEYNLHDRLLQLKLWKEMEKDDGSKEKPGDAYFESTGLMIARDGQFVLAAKAGNNGESHNHNDVGSVTLYKEGRPFLIDLGVETYTAKTFSDRRYEIWTMQSAWHNTVSFGALSTKGEEYAPQVLQKPGTAYAAREVKCRLSDPEAVLSMELSPAYGDRRIRKYGRTVSLKKGEGVRIRDEADAALPAVWTLLTYEKPEILEEEGRMRIVVGDLGEILGEGFLRAVVESRPVEDPRLQAAWKHDIWRILLEMKGKEAEVSIK